MMVITTTITAMIIITRSPLVSFDWQPNYEFIPGKDNENDNNKNKKQKKKSLILMGGCENAAGNSI